MKRALLVFLLIGPLLASRASHIVGGEFELLHRIGIQYQLNLILYFDAHNGNPLAKDQSVTVRIFRSRDNFVMRTITLGPPSESDVVYTNMACVIGELETKKLIYSTIILLPENDFNDSQGYYVAWERCCRNYEIDNIESNPPGLGQYAGQTFYLEFPAVVKNGEPFINSSPKLCQPLSDYACVGKPYYVEFRCDDEIDGDSLSYELVAPLNTLSSDALPPGGLPRPRPYPTVVWADDFGIENIMNGSPDLQISTDGVLTVTPTLTGLFVFAVRVSEFRDGIKIGETRRDFQMLVVNCPTSVPPKVKGRKLGDAGFTFVDNMTVTFPHTVSNNDRCIEIEISDNDIFNDGSEVVEIKRLIAGSGIRGEVIMPSNTRTTLNANTPSVTFRICFDECPPQRNTPYKISIIVKDDACALPLLDTLRLTVLVETPPNVPARFVNPDPDLTQSLFEGTSNQWPVQAVDDDSGDLLSVTYVTDGFNLVDYGMSLNLNQPQPNQSIGNLLWDAKCDAYDFSTRQNFHITLIADDNDKCQYNKADTARFSLALINPSADPVIDIDLTPVFSERFADGGQPRIYDQIQFNVFGTDADPFPISLEAEGVGFNLTDYGASFTSVSGISSIQSPFSWMLNCEPFHLAEKDTFAIRFMVLDRNNKCKIYQADTVEVGFKIRPPLNNQPAITAQNLHPETAISATEASTFWNKPIEFLLTGTDEFINPQRDNISIEMIEVAGSVPPENYTFTPVSGQDQIQTNFLWTPDCSIFKDQNFSNDYEFTFRVFDDHCESALADTLTLNINIKDYISTDENFNPTNAITPNGDDVNDFFALDGFELRDNGTDPNEEIGLPLDNCLNQFESISIYNRWGKLVFSSNNRYFRWYAPNMGAGVYYYLLKFTNKEYKSTVMVRY